MPFSFQIHPCAGGLRVVIVGLTSTLSSVLGSSVASSDVVIGATNPTSIASPVNVSSGFSGKPPLPISTNRLLAVCVQTF